MQSSNQKQLNDMLKQEQINQLSSEEQDDVSTYEQPQSRSGYRKPIRDPFSEESDSSSDNQFKGKNGQNESSISPFPPKQPKTKSILQQAQQTIKWNKEQQTQIQILSKLEGQGMKDKKIRQLAQKYKTLNLAYEKQRTIRRTLETQLNNQIKANEESLARTRSIQKQNNSTVKTLGGSQVKENTKCANHTCLQNQKKVMEFRLQNQNLKTQLNKAHRVIARQIGENFNIDQVLSQQNAWKGRQQKIEKLKGRIRQLEEKLANNGINVSHMSGFTQLSNATMRTTNNLNMTRTSTMAENKRKQLQNLKVQVEALKNQNQLLHNKVKSVNSRKLILQSQIKELKNDYEKKREIFLQKSQNDDKFITLLKNQNEKLKKEQKVVTKIVYRDQKDNQQVEGLKKELDKYKAYVHKIKQKQSNQKALQSKCLENNQNDEKIQNKFPPPSQKRKVSQERPESSSKQENTGRSEKHARQLSTQKKKQLENEYLKGEKYLKKLSIEEQASIYQDWKAGKKIK